MLVSTVATEENVQISGLKHRVYLPEQGEARCPAVFLVHGRAGNDTLMWTFSKVFEKFKPITIAPQAPVSDPIGGYSWWPIEDLPGAPQGLEKLKTPISGLEEFIEKVSTLYPIDKERMYAIGFSQGAGIVSALSLKNAALFRGVALLAGFLPRVVPESEGYIDNRIAKGTVKLPKYFIAHGTLDEQVPLSKAEFAKSTLESYGAEVHFHTEAVTHKVGAGGMKALEAWMDGVWGEA